MKVLFAGPSLHGTEWAGAEPVSRNGVECRGPAGQGDIARAVVDGATAIALIDGRYEDVAAVWHKEILYAIGEGVQTFGAASMGALRAAECADFGMIGVGAVFERYRSGELTEDAAVAQLHAPPEMQHAPLTEALVNVEATIAHFRKLGAVTEAEAAALDRTARALFFKERTWRRLLSEAGFASGERGKRVADLVRRCRVDIKQQDALALASYLVWLEPVRREPPKDWRVEPTQTWMLTLERARSAGAGAKPNNSMAA